MTIDLEGIKERKLAKLLALDNYISVHSWGDVRDALLELKLTRRNSPRWISVKPSRMPDIGTEVLVVNANDELGQEIVAVVARNHIKAANNADYQDFSDRGYTHWMPLPEPPSRETL